MVLIHPHTYIYTHIHMHTRPLHTNAHVFRLLLWFGETGHPRAALPWQSSNLAIANEAQRIAAPSLRVAWMF